MNEKIIHDFNQGKLVKSYEYLGAHYNEEETTFRVWAPNARSVSLIGDFNNWNPTLNKMIKISDHGFYEIRVKGIKEYTKYKYAIQTMDGRILEKADPYAFYAELRPNTASVVYNLKGFEFSDSSWIKERKKNNFYKMPINIYEMNIGSWKKQADGGFINFSSIANELCDYLIKMGYTHVELMPISEFPYDPSWGYQVTGYYAVTSRYGTPKDFMKFVNILHEHGIGVILDWVPGHFTKDAHGLIEFDGTYLFEPSNSFKMEHKGWGTRAFDYEKKEVLSFLISNAIFWVDYFHIDGIRVDAVSSILYLDYCRGPSEWLPNKDGGNYSLEGINFLQELNTAMKNYDPSVMMIAEESSAFPKVSHPVKEGGLGFDFKWNMGWMNDTLSFIRNDPYWRGDHLNDLTFQLTYIFSEHYILAISHDEVVHMKGSLINKMPGTEDQKFASLKSYFTYMLTLPGKKLLFMGSEFGQFSEWNEQKELDWELLGLDRHKNLQLYLKDLNKLYLENKILHDDTREWNGLKTIGEADKYHAVYAYCRTLAEEVYLIILNFAYCEWWGYQLAVDNGQYEVLICSEDVEYSGSKHLAKTIYEVKDNKLIIDLPYSSGIILRKVN